MPDFKLDWERGRLVVARALSAFKNGEYPYQGRFLPQDLIPPTIREDPLRTAQLLFYSCHYMRGTIKSHYAVRAVTTLCLHRDDLFDPARARLASHEDLTRELGSVLPYKLGEIPRSWIENSTRVHEHWDGDPRNIFAEVRNSLDLYRYVANDETTPGVARGSHPRERGFLGFQKKMASMLTYFFEDFGLIREVEWPPSPPVDFHLLRLLVSNGVIAVTSNDREYARYEELQGFGIEFLEAFIADTGERMRDVADALWMLSNRLCAEAPTNQTVEGKRIEVDWESDAARQQYAVTCGACPLRASCLYAVQASSYYHEGKFELGRPRTTPRDAASALWSSMPLVYKPTQAFFVPVERRYREEHQLLFPELPKEKPQTRDQRRRARLARLGR